jgi:putative hydrolase of the HAD superfamily
VTPKGLLLDYGGTLVEEVSVDLRAGNEWMLAQASHRPAGITLEHLVERADRITREVAAQRDRVHLETPWPALTRLIHDFLGIRFDMPMPDLEIGFWKASVTTRAMPGAREALEQCHRAGVAIGVVSNTSFGEPVIRYELSRHGLTDRLAFVMASSDYAVRKPNVRLFDTAAARLGVNARDIWFVGDRLDTDIAGAKAAGMKAVWFNPSGSQDEMRMADVSITDWADFMRHVSVSSA